MRVLRYFFSFVILATLNSQRLTRKDSLTAELGQDGTVLIGTVNVKAVAIYCNLFKMFFSLTLLLTASFVSGFTNQDNEVDPRYLSHDLELSTLRGKFGLFFEPDASRGESRSALRYILAFLNKRPGNVKPTAPATEDVCGENGSPSQLNTADGYSTKSLLPAMIGSMKEDALYHIL